MLNTHGIDRSREADMAALLARLRVQRPPPMWRLSSSSSSSSWSSSPQSIGTTAGLRRRTTSTAAAGGSLARAGGGGEGEGGGGGEGSRRAVGSQESGGGEAVLGENPAGHAAGESTSRPPLGGSLWTAPLGGSRWTAPLSGTGWTAPLGGSPSASSTSSPIASSTSSPASTGSAAPSASASRRPTPLTEAAERVKALLADRERVIVLNNVLRSAWRDDLRRFVAANLGSDAPDTERTRGQRTAMGECAVAHRCPTPTSHAFVPCSRVRAQGQWRHHGTLARAVSRPRPRRGRADLSERRAARDQHRLRPKGGACACAIPHAATPRR